MTPYEEYNQRMMQEAIRRQALGQPIPPGLMSQSAGPSAAAQGAAVDLTGAERGVAGQRAMANQLRGRAGPKGKTVGPSGLYVAPNWGESLEHLTNQLAAGYLGKKANEADIKLGADREKKNAAQLAYQAELLRGERGFETGMQDARFTQQDKIQGNLFGQQTSEREAGQAFTGQENEYSRGLEQSLAGARNLLTTRGQDMTSTTAANTLTGTNLRDRQDRQWQTPDGAIVNTIEAGGVQHKINPDGTIGVPTILPEGAIAVDTTATGSTSALDALAARQAQTEQDAIWESQVGMEQQVAKASDLVGSFTNVLENPSMDKFTGLLSLPRVLSVAGIGEDAWKGQNIDQQLKYGATSMVGDLAGIFKPMSDTDLKYLLSQFAGSTSEPKAITAWLGTNGRSTVRKQYELKRAELKTDGQKANLDKAWAQTEARLDMAVATSAKRQGIKLEDAKILGMTEDELTYLYGKLP